MSITIDLINEINAFVLSLTDDGDTKVVIFKSSNDTIFLAHLDVTVINGTPAGQSACTEFSHMIANIKAMRQASIAVVEGIARGGGNEFAMACHGVTFWSPAKAGIRHRYGCYSRPLQ